MDLSGFTITSARDVASDFDAVPQASGVYLLLLRLGTVLEKAGYAGSAPLVVMGHELAYIGSTAYLRGRIKYHLRGPSYASTLARSWRGSLGWLASTLGR